jgi:DNA polymerase III epsilon subunit-like protein
MAFKDRPAVKDCNLLFFDCETSGLSPIYHEMIEVGCILTDPTGRTVLKEYEAKILPTKPVDPNAAAVNGYSAEKWASEAVSLSLALKEVVSMAKDAVLVAHNAAFDWGFLESAIRQNAMRYPGPYHKCDTVAMAWPLLKEGKVPNLKLQTLTEYFKISHLDAHTALSDVRACRDLYLRLMELVHIK